MNPQVKLFLLPGGQLPERKTEEAAGFDVFLRNIVSAHEMDTQNPNLRKTLFDFKRYPDNPDVARHILEIGDELIYRMDPLESVLIGIGFLVEMKFPLFFFVAPRSGYASRWGITITNAPGTVDADYRGEAGALVYNRNNHPFDLKLNMRIAQIIFQYAVIPDFIQVNSSDDLRSTDRGAGGFGSTGL